MKVILYTLSKGFVIILTHYYKRGKGVREGEGGKGLGMGVREWREVRGEMGQHLGPPL